MKILKEGTIEILSDGQVVARNFEVSGEGSVAELEAEVCRRVRLAAEKCAPRREPEAE